MYYEKLLKPRNKVYLTPELFMAEVVEYFKWAEEHPLLEGRAATHKVKSVDGDSSEEWIKVTRYDVPKMRVFTKQGLANYLNIPVRRLDGYKKRGDGWKEAVEMIEQVIYTQKFEGASAGLLNANIISRDLGLAEKQEVAQHVTDDTSTPEPDKQRELEQHMAIHIHPNDPDPLGMDTGVLPRPLYSKAQLDAGVEFSHGKDIHSTVV